MAKALGFKVEKKVKTQGQEGSAEELAKVLKEEDVEGVGKVEGLEYGRFCLDSEGADGSVNLNIGASLPDGNVQDRPHSEVSQNGVSVDLMVKVDEGEEVVQREDGERQKRRHQHQHQDDEERSRHKNRH